MVKERNMNLELGAGLEYKFWLWMSKQGAYSNLRLELREYGLMYDNMINAMVDSYMNDHYKLVYFTPFTGFLLFEQEEISIYGIKYWKKIQLQWKRYATGKSST